MFNLRVKKGVELKVELGVELRIESNLLRFVVGVVLAESSLMRERRSRLSCLALQAFEPPLRSALEELTHELS